MTRPLKYALIAGGVSTALAVGASVAAVATAVRLTAKMRRARFRRSFEGQVVLITGGSRGLGLALAREFVLAGSRVSICARDEVELQNAKAWLQRYGATVLPLVCDVSDQASVHHLLERVREEMGRIDILVNNAGEITVGPIENTQVADFERAMAVMFWGVLYPTLGVLEEMKLRGHGRIATITSIGGKVSIPHLLPYCCAKFAAVGFCEGLRAEVARHGVKVTTIAPGLMRTGSHLQANFKGNVSAESTWFGLGATLPGISMGAERAAKQIIGAIAKGKSEKILSTQANVLARMNAAFPGLVPDVLSIVARFLPDGTTDREYSATGAQLEKDKGALFRAFTTLGRRAARELNQVRLPEPVAGNAI